MSVNILCVDDEVNILDGYKRSLRKHFEIHTAQGGEEALEKLVSAGPFAVVVSDMHMPGMNGIQFLARAKEIAPDTVRMMLTGNADMMTAVNALNEGSIFRFLIKPVSNESMASILDAGVAQYRLITAERELLEMTLRGSIRILTEILSTISPEMFGEAMHVRNEIRMVGEALGVSDIWTLELAAMLSQIAMVTMPPVVTAKLQKGLTLTAAEQALTERIPEISYNLLVNIPRLETVAAVIRDMSKKYDPLDQTSESIHIGSRILRVLLDLHRIQKRGVSPSGALTIMRRPELGYDVHVLDAVAGRVARKEAEEVPQTAAVPIRLSQLKVSHVLLEDIISEDGVLLISAGHPLSAALLEKLNNYAAIVPVKEPILIKRPESTARRAA